jgi:hypothetical protein
MKLILSMIFAGAALTAMPAFAAPQLVEDACRRAAVRVLPALSAREVEAYVAIASLTGRLERHRPKAKRITTATGIDQLLARFRPASFSHCSA